MGWRHPRLGWVFSPQPNLDTSSQTCSECLSLATLEPAKLTVSIIPPLLGGYLSPIPEKEGSGVGLESGPLGSETFCSESVLPGIAPEAFLALPAKKPRLQVGDLPRVFSQPLLSCPREGWCSVPTSWAVPSTSSSFPAASSPFSPDASSPLLQMPAEFFHPAVSASQKGQEPGMSAGTLPKIALQGSWASLRSPSVNCTLLRQVQAPPEL